MPRRESRTKTSIWADADFVKLTASAQRFYWLLYTQPTISLCGVVALTEKRWIACAADTPIEVVRAALDELEERRYVLLDFDTEEVLVRTFARHDGVGKNSKVLTAAFRQLDLVVSPALRAAAERELMTLRDTPPDTPSIPPPDPIDTPSDSQSSRARAVPSPQSPVSNHQSPVPARTRASTPTTDPPERDRDGGLRPKGDETKPGTLAQRAAATCTARKRELVAIEAASVVSWALTAVDARVVEEAIGWAESLPEPLTLPRAIAPVIQAKAAALGISLADFSPQSPVVKRP